MGSKTKLEPTEPQGFTTPPWTKGPSAHREFARYPDSKTLDGVQPMVQEVWCVIINPFAFVGYPSGAHRDCVDSEMVYFEALGKTFLILNSLQTVQDLLVKRSEKYSDRPRMPMICEVFVVSCSQSLVLRWLNSCTGWTTTGQSASWGTGINGATTVEPLRSTSTTLQFRNITRCNFEKLEPSFSACFSLMQLPSSFTIFDSKHSSLNAVPWH